MQLDFVNEVAGKNQLRSILSDIIDVDEERIKDDTHFMKDLGIDSLMGLEIMVKLEKKYQIKISEKELSQLMCLNDVYQLLKTKSAQNV